MRKGQKNSPETIAKMSVAAKRRWASGVYSAETWERMAQTFRRHYAEHPWKNGMRNPVVAAKVWAARRASGKDRWSPESRRKFRNNILRRYREGEWRSPFTDPVIHAKAMATREANGNPASRPEVRYRISRTIKRQYASGQRVVSPHFLKAQRKSAALRRGVPLTDAKRAMISAGMRRAHAEGRAGKGGPISLGEQQIWPYLRRYGFKRQVPFRFNGVDKTFRVDFAHLTAYLCIEIDGRHHFTREGAAADRTRDALFQSHGFLVVRLPEGSTRQHPKRFANVIRQMLPPKP